jgi:protein-tyrosine phosphatase/rhodanese-related sulfurtransferase
MADNGNIGKVTYIDASDWLDARDDEPLSPHALAEVERIAALVGQDDTIVLVLDIRSFFIYEEEHIEGSVNISLPRVLLSSTVSFRKVEAVITGDRDKALFHEREGKVVVLYANEVSKPVEVLRDMLVEEGVVKEVHVLECGLKTFAQTYPDLIYTAPEPEPEELVNPFEQMEFAPPTPSMAGRAFGGEGAFGAPAFCGCGSLGWEIVPPDQIVTGLLLGAIYNVPRDLENQNVQAILNVSSLEYVSPLESHITYKEVQLKDIADQPLIPYIGECVDFIHEQVELLKEGGDGGNILVHCQAGVSRSSSIVIAYLVRHRDMTLKDAHEWVKACRPRIEPNTGFIMELMRYEIELRGESSYTDDSAYGFLVRDIVDGDVDVDKS